MFDSVDVANDSSGEIIGYANDGILDQMFCVLRATAYCHETEKCT